VAQAKGREVVYQDLDTADLGMAGLATDCFGMTFWALDRNGAKVEDVRLVAGPAVLTGYKPVEVVDSPKWTQRMGAY